MKLIEHKYVFLHICSLADVCFECLVHMLTHYSVNDCPGFYHVTVCVYFIHPHALNLKCQTLSNYVWSKHCVCMLDVPHSRQRVGILRIDCRFWRFLLVHKMHVLLYKGTTMEIVGQWIICRHVVLTAVHVQSNARTHSHEQIIAVQFPCHITDRIIHPCIYPEVLTIT